MRLYLIRHPRPDVAEGICYGQSDLPLAESATAVAAELLGRLPAGLPLYSSPLRRCRELAQALHANPRLDTRLQEMHFGSWEMQAWAAIDSKALEAWAADPMHFAPPDGESVARLVRRAGEFVAELAGDAVIVTHAGVIKALAGSARGAPHHEWFRYSFAFGSLTVLDWHGAAR